MPSLPTTPRVAAKDSASQHMGGATALNLPVIYICPGITPNGVGERLLKESLSKTYETVLLSYPNWRKGAQADSTFDSIIVDLLHEIDSHSSSRPIFLVGYSFGGYCAYVCCVRLEAAGKSIKGIAILDAVAQFEAMIPSRSKRIRLRCEKLATLDICQGLASLLAKGMTREPGLPLLRWASGFHNVRLPLNFGSFLDRKLTMQLLWRRCRAYWRTRQLPEEALLTPAFVYRSNAHAASQPEDLGWSSHFKNVTSFSLAIDHEHVLGPQQIEFVLATLSGAALNEPDRNTVPMARRDTSNVDSSPRSTRRYVAGVPVNG